MRFLLAAMLGMVVLLGSAHAQQSFIVQDIRVEGLQRVSAGTVFSYLPVKIGDRIDSESTAKAIRDLFKTGFFKDVRIEREGDTLVVVVQERPSVAEIEFRGNKELETEQLLDSLKNVGFATGRVFNRSIFERTKQELRDAYFSQGRYAVDIETTLTPLSRNRVGVVFDINEGSVAKIRQINIVGNESYDEDDLLDLFELTTPTLWSWVTDTDQYSKQRLAADLEKLRSFYLDSGYINFNIDSTQVSITADRQSVFITVNITEGEKFTVRDIKLSGDIVVQKEELFPLIVVHEDQVFSRKKITETTTNITERLGNEGYAFANVNAIPEIDTENKKVDITFFTDPGKRVYVRRVLFRGNTKTQDEVLRREMRQFEGSWISTGDVERSRIRLRRLGFFETVNIETPAVPGTTDQVDVVVTVVEKPSGNIAAGIGISQSQGVVFNASVRQENFLGTGNTVGATFNNSSVNRAFGFEYNNPYWTLDGISRGFELSYRETDASEANLADYTTDVAFGAVRFGIPLNEFDSIRAGFRIEHTDFTASSNAGRRVRQFGRDHGGGYLNYVGSLAWSRDSRNAAVLPDRGSLTRAAADLAVPGSELSYYTLSLRHQQFLPITRFFTLMLDGEVGYGDGYGDIDELPLVNNFFAGGIRSLRGFESNSLGPRDTNNEPLGGSFKLLGKAEIILPIPFVKESRSFRLTGFLDAGNVYDGPDDVTFDSLRYSAGLSAIWLSPFGALTLSAAQPLNDEAGDQVQQLQFTFGTSF